MRSVFTVVTLMLVLVLATGGDLSGYDCFYIDDSRGSNVGGPTGGFTPSGDDHPWGGEEGTPAPDGFSATPQVSPTGQRWIDVLITKLVLWYLPEPAPAINQQDNAVIVESDSRVNSTTNRRDGR